MPFAIVPRSAPPLEREAYNRYTPTEVMFEIQTWAQYHDGKPPRWSDWHKGTARRYGHVFELGWPGTGAVAAHFGSFSAGISAAGFELPTPGAPVETKRCINLDCGVSFPSRGSMRCDRCTNYRKRTGEEWSPERVKRNRGRIQHEEFDDRITRLIAMRKDGLLNSEIGEAEGCSKYAIGTAFLRGREQGYDVPVSPWFVSSRG